MLLRLFDYLTKPSSKKLEIVRDFIGRQILQLRSEGEFLLINQVTFAYVLACICTITKRPGSLDLTRQVIRELIPEEEYFLSIENAHQIAVQSSDFWDKCNALIPVISSELESGVGIYLVKYTRKARKEMESLFHEGEIPDLSDVDPMDFLKV